MIIHGDARSIPLRDGCVQCVVTSPPYFQLRDYGVAGQIGMESTLEAYVGALVGVFREVARVCRSDATVWLNLGDSYSGSMKGWSPNGPGYGGPKQRTNNGSMGLKPLRPGSSRADGVVDGRSIRNRDGLGAVSGLKPKDLCGIPWRVAFALQADGWYLRSDIVWAKPNPMPESVTDRPTRSHEYIFLLSKSERYFYDADAIREPSARESSGNKERFIAGGSELNGKSRLNTHMGSSVPWEGSERNRRDVWTVNSEPTPEAHFATFPQKLIEPCILAGTSEKGCCAECGAPRVRVTERVTVKPIQSGNREKGKAAHWKRSSHCAKGDNEEWTPPKTTGWRPSCDHDAPSVGCLVLDPFLGSGTVGRVCERLGRRWAGIELSLAYIGIAKKRTAQMGLLL